MLCQSYDLTNAYQRSTKVFGVLHVGLVKQRCNCTPWFLKIVLMTPFTLKVTILIINTILFYIKIAVEAVVQFDPVIIYAALLCKCSVLFSKPSREISTTMKHIHYDNACTSGVVHRLSNFPYLVQFTYIRFRSNSLINANIENTITNRIVRIIETWTWFTEWPHTSYVRLNNGSVYLQMTTETPRGKTCNWIVNYMECHFRLKQFFISRLFVSMLE